LTKENIRSFSKYRNFYFSSENCEICSNFSTKCFEIRRCEYKRNIRKSRLSQNFHFKSW